MTETFTGPGQVVILAATAATLITTIATLIYNYKREGRRQEWERERREWEEGAAARHAVATAAAKKEREEIAKRVEEAEASLNAKMDENTEISRQAFTEANHINEKIKAQGEAFDKMLRTALEARTASTLQAAVEDTREKVTDIHAKVVENGDT